jgi:hypothetical protein
MDQGQTEGTTKEEVESQEEESPLFPYEDMRRIVRDWIEALIRGDIQIPITKESVKKGYPGNRELFAQKTEAEIFELIEIASGSNLQASRFEQSKVIKALFGYIIMFRQKGMMTGTFSLSTELSVKLEKLERIVGQLTGTVEHLDKFAPELQDLKEYKPFFEQMRRYLNKTEKEWDKGEEAGKKDWR